MESCNRIACQDILLVNTGFRWERGARGDLKGAESMDIGVVTDLTQETLYVILTTAAPLLLISLTVGLTISVFQTVTSIQEQTLTFVPKVISIFIGIMLLGHWMLENMVGFMIKLWSDFSVYIR